MAVLKDFRLVSYEIFFGDPNMIQKSDDNGRPLKGLSIIKKKIKVLEEERNTDRSSYSWQELKTLKKQKLKLKDKLLT